MLPAYANATDYYPLQAGRVWFYRLDSTTIPPFGTSLIVHSYHLKDSVGISFLDNDGQNIVANLSFYNRYVGRKSVAKYFYLLCNSNTNDVEVVDDNNLRFIKLISPVSDRKKLERK